MQIAVLHATRISQEPVEKILAQEFSQMEALHILDEGLSHLAKKEGSISPRNLLRMAGLIRSAEDLGVEGILMACTIFSPYADLLSSFCNIPLVAADVAMFEKAARLYKKVCVIVTFEPTVKSVSDVIKNIEKRMGPLNASIHLVPGAMQAAGEGREEEHNRLIFNCAAKEAKDSDAVILAQMSHMRALPLFKDFPLPVLTSPPISIAALKGKIEIEKGLRF